MIKCDICKKEVNSLKHEFGKDFCRKCYEYYLYMQGNELSGIPRFILAIAYILGKPIGKILKYIKVNKKIVEQKYERSKSFSIIQKTFLRGYGLVEVSRLKEMDRRVILPYEREGGGYYLGRKGENGKIQEKLPSY